MKTPLLPVLLLAAASAFAQVPSPFTKPLPLPGATGEKYEDVRAGWKMPKGRWVATGPAEIEQHDTKETCSNAFKSIPQTGRMEYRLKQKYLKGKSACTTIYFMSDDGAKLERGNAYMIADAFDEKGKAEVSINKIVNNGAPKTAAAFPVAGISGQWIDLRITYDADSGKIAVERNGKPVGEWTDPEPMKTGKDFSIGTCLTKASFKDMLVQPLR